MNRNTLLVSLILGMAGAAVAVGGAPVRDHDIVSDDYFGLGTITGCAMSPSGQFIAYTEMRWEPSADKRNTDIWLVTTKSHDVTRLTFDPTGDGSVRWSPDEKWIYFASARKRAGEDKPPYDGKRQVWRMRADGSDMQAVTRIDDGIIAYQLSDDGQSLYYTVSEKVVEDDFWKALRNEFSELEYGHGVEKFTRIWKLDLRSWRAKKLVEQDRVINEFAVSPNERWIAMQTTPTHELITNEGWSHIDVYDTKNETVYTLPDKAWRQDAPSPYGWLTGLAWSDDSRAVSFGVGFDGYPQQVFIAEFDADKHVSTQELVIPGVETPTPGDEVFITGHLRWLPGTRDLCFTAEDHARSHIYCAREVRRGRQGKTDRLTGGDAVVKTFSFNRNGAQLAIVMPTVTHPPDIFAGKVSRTPIRLDRITKVNPQVDTWKLPTIQTATWTSQDGTEVQGILELPPEYEPGTRLPTVIELHGGPTSASMLEMRFWIYGRTLLPARGWALLSPNYRGSTGFGDKFLTELIGHKNDRDVADIMAGVDWIIDEGIADGDKLAVMGWSNGGYLTNCLIAHTTRFKAASSGAGVFDTVLQWLVEDTPGHVINFNQGFPWNKTEQMQRASALYNADKITTPTLIHVGENDPRVPPGHSRGLYRTLRHYLKVPTELIVYPGEGHGLTTYKHRKAKMEWDIKWFDYHVLGQTTEEHEATPAVD